MEKVFRGGEGSLTSRVESVAREVGLTLTQLKEKSPQEMQQKMMLYGLPIMIGVFAVQFPAAVSLYWGVSTVFAIGQQVVVNRKELR